MARIIDKKKLAVFGGFPIRQKTLPFGRPDVGKLEAEIASKVVKSKWIGTGPKVAEFELTIKKYLGANYVLATNSASAALHVSLLVAGISKGDEVITTTITFPSSVNVIENVGAKPVFVDIEPDTGLINPKLIEGTITKKTKAILLVHLYGYPCDLEEIKRIANKHNLKIIEDAAEAFGAEYSGKKIGSKGEFVAFSFAVNKVITTAEGGVFVTDNKKHYEQAKKLVLHGMSKGALKKFPYKGFTEHKVVIPGYKYNMTDIHAGIGLVQMKQIESRLAKREKIARRYDRAFEKHPVSMLRKPGKGIKHGRCFYALRLKLDELRADRNTILAAMYAEGIGTNVHFLPMHLQPYYKNKYGFKKGDFPEAESFYRSTLSLPLASDLTPGDIGDTVAALKKVLLYYTL